jgi:hypothetical protein
MDFNVIFSWVRNQDIVVEAPLSFGLLALEKLSSVF